MNQIISTSPDQLHTFSFGQLTLRALLLNGEPWFVAADVARALEYRDAHNMFRGIDQEDKGYSLLSTPGGNQQMTTVNESGLYTAIVRANTERAKPFRRWVTSEVLPAIRKTGSYQAPQTLEERALSVITDLTAQVEEQRALNAQQAAELEAARPAIEYVETQVLKDDDVLTVKDWGLRFGLTQHQAYKLLTERRVLQRKKVGERWSRSKRGKKEEFEYRPYADFRGFFALRGHHNVTRLYNGQIRQTAYVKAFHALDLARRVGLLNEVEDVV